MRHGRRSKVISREDSSQNSDDAMGRRQEILNLRTGGSSFSFWKSLSLLLLSHLCFALLVFMSIVDSTEEE